MNRFTLPRDIYYGRGATEFLSQLGAQRAMIVTGGTSIKKFGFLDRVTNLLKQSGAQVRVFDNVEPDPSVETVMSGAKAMSDFSPDWIIALGGGSPIDAAKAMWTFYEYPETSFEELCIPFNFPKLRQKAHFLAIPTTSGTATEVTAFSVITDYSKGVKYPLADFNITPDIALVDPDFAATMPEKLCAYTGMDALTHAIEAYVSTLATPFTDPLALQAIKMVFEFLPAAVPGDKEAREEMHYAQCLAGMAFSNALLGIVHSMAHKTGAAFSTGHIAHGCANAIYLPYVIKYNMRDARAAARYAEIAEECKIEFSSNEEAAERLCQKIDGFNQNFGIPRTLQEFGIEHDEFEKRLPEIAALAVGDACTGSSPRKIDEKTMEKLFTCIYNGSEVDF